MKYRIAAIIMVVILAISQIVSAATISVEPSCLKVLPGDEFTVNITVEPEESEVFGAQYELYFNSTLLNAFGPDQGPFLRQDGNNSYVYKKESDNTIGKVEYAETRIDTTVGVINPGVLAKIRFKVIGNYGISGLRFEVVKLVAPPPNETSLPPPIQAQINNGSVEIAQPSTPFLINGYVFYENDTACNNPRVNITNLNRNKEWRAETNESYNYYQCMNTSCTDIAAGDVLQFEVTSPYGCQLNITNYTITADDIANGGLFNFNISLESPEKPDLVITDAWVCWPHNCTICYTIMNLDYGIAPAGHNTTLYVDGDEKAHDEVPVVLVTGDSYTGCFEGYSWSYTPTEDNITVCADNNGTVTESNETNNCLTDTWMCGDVDGNGEITTSDAFRVYFAAAYEDLSYVDSGWVADADGNGEITTSDAFRVYFAAAYEDLGYLSCMCS